MAQSQVEDVRAVAFMDKVRSWIPAFNGTPVPAQPVTVPVASGGGNGGDNHNHGGGGGGNRGGSHPSSSSNFFEGMTFLSLLKSLGGLLAIFGGVWWATHDTPPNRTSTELATVELKKEEEKTKQAKLLGGSVPFFSQSAPQQATTGSCTHLSDVTPLSFVLARGNCFSVGATPTTFFVGAESPITSVTGSDFLVISHDGSSLCESNKTSDRCVSWIKEHQFLSPPDTSDGKPRYWLTYKAYGNININSA